MHPRAFSLIELVLVLVILGIITAIAAPRLSGASQRQRLLAASERLALDVARAREATRAASGVGTMQFSRTGYHWSVLAGGAAGASANVTLLEAPYFVQISLVDAGGDDTVVFDGYGTPDSAVAVTLEAGAFQVSFSMDKAGVPTLGAMTGSTR